MFESQEGPVLTFRFDDHLIKINFNTFALECRASNKPLRSYVEWAQDTLIEKQESLTSGEIEFSDLMNELAEEYQRKFYPDEEEDFSEGDSDEYAQENMDIARPSQKEETKVIEEEVKVDPALEEKLNKLEQAFSGQGSATANKRILQEYKYLTNSKECKGLTVDFEGGSNMYVWIVKLDVKIFEIDKELKKDFEKYAAKYNQNQEIVFELRFDSHFPFNPPFLRVVRPRFMFRTGHVTIGGSICMESLTPSGWIPVRTVESIFVEILFNMTEGGARLDPVSANLEYSLAEAQEAFTRVAQQHRWI
mmetsp:Transcript_9194/g.9152  ORF Transcript_9194/g.9152 Transcript_9194/m.9152 type:complete len:306 (-) Transcript_9194:37-954(-)|eukprot:CAMPEP_0202948730 /NCGR_PEP_ID=MMETSP1395-20130829/14412_1 /ASSEMBLY_ACC=CAM_ASM_000871 /TAXON_ID=5961 /ORGANISM="Blepharisma japonicum, Strain Stock R1072" /LENGTH=305 /DNA_ID=CAMNT_0049651073 /DNA_START=81 /DNA_END=998 /DNA_ORIENTATION=+